MYRKTYRSWVQLGERSRERKTTYRSSFGFEPPPNDWLNRSSNWIKTMVRGRVSRRTYGVRITLRVVVFFFLWLPMFTSEAAACDCAFGGGTPCQDYWEVSAVFVGVVTGSSRVTVDQGGYAHTQRLVQFSLDRAYKGIEGAEAQVITGLGDADCGYGFRLGEKYLVYAYRDKEYNFIPVVYPGRALFPKLKKILITSAGSRLLLEVR